MKMKEIINVLIYQSHEHELNKLLTSTQFYYTASQLSVKTKTQSSTYIVPIGLLSQP